MEAIYVKEEQLRSYCERAFKKYGFNEKDSKTITDVLVAADMYGIETHGSQRLEMYRQHIKKGYIEVGAQPSIEFETGISAVVNGNRGMGQVVSKYAMDVAIEKAKKTGIGMVTVKNSNHYGIAGYYSNMASDQGMIGISATNSFPVVVPTFGRKPMMGTNPIAISIPSKPNLFYFDVATSVAALGKVEVRNKKGVDLPVGWGVNEEGKDEVNPQHLFDNVMNREGGMYPVGGSSQLFGSHKGYGFSLLVEFLTGILSGGVTSNHTEENGIMGICHYFMAIDPKLFGNPESIVEKWSTYLQELRDSEKAYGQERIYTHGEKEAEKKEAYKKSGVPILPKTIEEMKSLANQLGMEFGIDA